VKGGRACDEIRDRPKKSQDIAFNRGFYEWAPHSIHAGNAQPQQAYISTTDGGGDHGGERRVRASGGGARQRQRARASSLGDEGGRGEEGGCDGLI
jgi:hypothetical protein